VAAREAIVEALATKGLIANEPFRVLVRQLCAPPGKGNPYGSNARKVEAEEAIRRAEDGIRTEMVTNAQRDRATSYRRLLNTARKVYTTLELSTDAKEIASLSQRVVAVEARLAQLAGWNEPERLQVIVTNPSDRVRKAFEGFDDEALIALAVEEEERVRTVRAARLALGMGPEPVIIIEGDQ
jgi:hypothetical protein